MVFQHLQCRYRIALCRPARTATHLVESALGCHAKIHPDRHRAPSLLATHHRQYQSTAHHRRNIYGVVAQSVATTRAMPALDRKIGEQPTGAELQVDLANKPPTSIDRARISRGLCHFELCPAAAQVFKQISRSKLNYHTTGSTSYPARIVPARMQRMPSI